MGEVMIAMTAIVATIKRRTMVQGEKVIYCCPMLYALDLRCKYAAPRPKANGGKRKNENKKCLRGMKEGDKTK